jgi:hypothetical protein
MPHKTSRLPISISAIWEVTGIGCGEPRNVGTPIAALKRDVLRHGSRGRLLVRFAA